MTVTLLGGPLHGYEHTLQPDQHDVLLRFNGRREWVQHIYRQTGSTATGPVYEYTGDDTDTSQPLPFPGIHVPAHAFNGDV